MSTIYEKIVLEDLNLGTGTVQVTMPGGGVAVGTQINLSSFITGLNGTSNFPGLWGDQLVAASAALPNGGLTITYPDLLQPVGAGVMIVTMPNINEGVGMLTHSPFPWSKSANALGFDVSMISLSFENLNFNPSQMNGIKIVTDTNAVDTGAGIAIFNIGLSDGIYINLSGKTAAYGGTNAPTGLAIDVNKKVADDTQQDTTSSQQGIQVWDWSTTDQGAGGPRCLFLNKISNLNSAHFLMTLRANQHALQIVTKTAQGGYDSTLPILEVGDESGTAAKFVMTAAGTVTLGPASLGLQFVMSSGNNAWIQKRTTELVIGGGTGGVRINNNADTYTPMLIDGSTGAITWSNSDSSRVFRAFNNSNRNVEVISTGNKAASLTLSVAGTVSREWEVAVNDVSGYFHIKDLSSAIPRLKILTAGQTIIDGELQLSTGALYLSTPTSASLGINFNMTAGNDAVILQNGNFLAFKGGTAGIEFISNAGGDVALIDPSGNLYLTGSIIERARAAAIGVTVTPTYSAGDFVASTGTWVVEEVDSTTAPAVYAYSMLGTEMTLYCTLNATTTTGTPASLRITIPAGKTVAKETSVIGGYSVGSGLIPTLIVRAVTGNSYVELYKDTTSTSWDTYTNTLYVQFQIKFQFA